MSVSLITACKNRNESLKSVLSSWLALDCVNEIIVVDWCSDNPLNEIKYVDKRIKIVRVENEKFYIPSQANNLAASHVTNDYILRVDTDYFFNPYYNFFNEYKIDNTCFVSGEPEVNSDRENNPYYKYLFGLLYVSKENFQKINGYNENIGVYYSHEDKDIFERLKLLGLKQIKLKNNHYIIHIPHSDKKRVENFEGGQDIIVDGTFTVETHIGKNLNIFKPPTTFWVDRKIKWNINNMDNQTFYAKKVNNILDGMPQINCISLEESYDRRDNLLKQFKKYNINSICFLISKRFAESKEQIEGIYSNTLNEGTAGCCISHLKIIQQWLKTTTEEYGFFCEDDLSLETVEYWKKNWNVLINEFPPDWDCVQLLTIREDNLSLNVRERMWNDWGATAYILKRNYAQKIVNTYIQNNKYLLQLPEPNTNIQPLVENLIFTLGKTYTIPLFVEDVAFTSTFINSDDDIDSTTLHKNNHILAAKKVLELWKVQNCPIHNFAINVDDPLCNFKTGLYYYNQGHTAPALSFFLRCAERSEDNLLAYEALIFGYLCYKEQKIRDETAKSLIMHAVCLLPERPEARWLLSVFFEQKQHWMYSYYHAEQGLKYYNDNWTPLKFYKQYPGKISLLFQKAIAGYWWGKNDECREILLDLHNNYQLPENYKQSVKDNLKRIGIEVP